MRTKLVAAFAVLLMASIVLSCFVALSVATPGVHNGKSASAHKTFSSFALVADGTGRTEDGVVPIHIEISGKANGRERTVFHMRTQGGAVTAGSFDLMTAIKGQGVIVNKNNFIHLNLMLGGTYYGGRNTVWILRGTTGDLQEDNSMTVDLTFRRVILPLDGYPQLKGLEHLKGTIIFYP